MPQRIATGILRGVPTDPATQDDNCLRISGALQESEFLAALAQVESDGNPIARTYWRWQWSWSPFEIYRPASSALGMFQIIDGTFARARKYCIRNHTVVTEGPWYDLNSCWFNSLYARTLPSHAVEMTAAYLHQSVIDTLATRRTAKVSLAQKQKLAAVIHLCGLKRGQTFAAREFRVTHGELCGTHSLQRYLIQIDRMKKSFARLAGNLPKESPASLHSRLDGLTGANLRRSNATKVSAKL